MRIERLRQLLVHVDVVAAHQVNALVLLDDLLNGALVRHMVGDPWRRHFRVLQPDSVAVALKRLNDFAKKEKCSMNTAAICVHLFPPVGACGTSKSIRNLQENYVPR